LVNFSFVSGFIIGLLLGLILAGYFCLHLLEMRSRRH
jgi:ABC-type lipoprotein release transport system permease subunit